MQDELTLRQLSELFYFWNKGNIKSIWISKISVQKDSALQLIFAKKASYSFRIIFFFHTHILGTLQLLQCLIPTDFIALKIESCKLHNNNYIIASTQMTNTEIFALMAVLVFKLLRRKVLLIKRKDNRNC